MNMISATEAKSNCMLFHKNILTHINEKILTASNLGKSYIDYELPDIEIKIKHLIIDDIKNLGYDVNSYGTDYKIVIKWI